MPVTNIRIRPAAHKALREIAAMTGESLQDALDRAIDERRRRIYLEGVNADYAALHRDPKALADFRKETAVWDAANLDGLENA